MPKVSEAYTDGRREHILRTASECVYEKGFNATQMREVAERAGLSTGALYRYFASKEELFRAVVDWLRPGEAELRKQLFGEGTPGERLAALPGRLVRLALSTDDLSRKHLVHYGEAASIPFVEEVLGEMVVEVTDELEALVREGQETGDVDPALDPVMTASVLATLMVSIDFARVFEKRFDGPRVTEALEAMIAGLRPRGG